MTEHTADRAKYPLLFSASYLEEGIDQATLTIWTSLKAEKKPQMAFKKSIDLIFPWSLLPFLISLLLISLFYRFLIPEKLEAANE